MGPMDWYSSHEFKSSCIPNRNPFLLGRAKQGDQTGKRQGTSVFCVSQRSQRKEKFILELLAFSELSRASLEAQRGQWPLLLGLVLSGVGVGDQMGHCSQKPSKMSQAGWGAHFRLCSHVKAMQLVSSQRCRLCHSCVRGLWVALILSVPRCPSSSVE